MSEMDRIIKRRWVIVVLFLSVLLAAFLAGRYLQGGAAVWPGWINRENNVRNTSAELPSTVPDVFGSVESMKDRGFSVNEYPVIGGAVHVGSKADDGGAPLDVIITHETVIYEDVTDRFTPVVQDGANIQVVNKAKLDQIGPNAFVMIWGRRQDERILADVICFQNR